MKLKTGTMLGEFRVERLLSNQGATAHVYLARRETQQVALKIARVEGKNNSVFQDHLRQEAEILQKLAHISIVRLFPVLSDNIYAARAENLPQQPWYVAMEFIEGESLATHLPYIASEFPLEWRLELFHLIIQSVAYLHAQGFAHCDLKPENIFLRASSALQPVLIDFGAACSISAPPPLLSATMPYSAPELLRALSNPKAASELHPELLDAWALGAILYELAVGQRLIQGNTRRAITKNILNGNFDLTRAPLTLHPLLAKMLQPLPDKRVSIREIQAEFTKTM